VARIHILGDGDDARVILNWLSREAAIAAEDIASIIDCREGSARGTSDPARIRTISADELGSAVAAEDIVIIASTDFDAIVGDLFEMGIFNVYSGNEIIRRETASARFRRVGSDLYVGPADRLDDRVEREKYLRYSADFLVPGQIPSHKLFVVNSMPKSGTVWLIAMLEELLGVSAEKQIALSHVGEIERDWLKENNHGAVALVRDLRDVVVSWFYHVRRTDLQFGYASPRYPTVEDFYRSYFVGLICDAERYYRGDFESWLNFAGANNFPIVRYEDLVADTRCELDRIANFWRLKISPERGGEVAENYTFGAMKDTVSGREGFVAEALKTGHMRRGEPGSWRDEMPERIAMDIDRRFGAYQERLGYLD